MRTWLKRRRWWLLFGLVVVGALAIFAIELFTRDPAHLAFDSVRLDMTEEECDAVMNAPPWEGNVLVFDSDAEEFPAGGTAIIAAADAVRAYQFKSGRIAVFLRNNRVIYSVTTASYQMPGRNWFISSTALGM
jgi:hypothetical protein